MIKFNHIIHTVNSQTIVLILLVISLLACNKEEDPLIKRLDESQTERLLSTDTSKVWQLVNRYIDDQLQSMEVCEQETQLIFVFDSDESLKTFTYDDTCDQEILLSGHWRAKNLAQTPVTDSLLFLLNPDTSIIGEEEVVSFDTIFLTIETVTSQFLTLFKTETINGTPVLVKEDFIVE